MTLREMKIDKRSPLQNLSKRSVRANREAVQVVLDNMVDNAVKFSYRGQTIKLAIEMEMIEEKEHCVIWVWNFGNGILFEEKERVWEKLYRGKCSSTRALKSSGTGLGMYIIRKTIEHFGGKTFLDSNFGTDLNRNRGEGFWTMVKIALPLCE
jgi:signal transduction histidine kinase